MARKGHNRPASLVQIAGSGSTYPDDGSSPVGSNEWNANRDTTGVHGFTKKTEAIDGSYNINITDSYVEVTNAGEIRTMSQITGMGTLSTDNYPSDTSTTSFAEGDLLYLVKATAGHTITLKNQQGGAGAGKITTLSGGDLLLDVNIPRIFICRTVGSYQEWVEYGGGVVADLGITTAKLAADAVTAAKLADDVVDSEHLAAGGIDTEHLAADSVDGTKIADDAIDSEHYTDGSIDNAHIADDAIDSEHYADGSIDNAHIADDAIDSEHYAAGSIDTAHIADNQITLAKMAGGTDGELITYDASGDPAAVAVGTATHVLTSNGVGVAPTFQAAAGGGATAVHAFSNTTTTTYPGTASSFGSVGAGDRDIYIKKIDANNEGVFCKIWKDGVAVEVQIA